MTEPSGPPAVPRAARNLGYAGLIPFILASVGLWLLPLVYAGFLHAALIGYGLVIVSFMGGVQWGLGIARPLDDGKTWRVLSQSIAPPLIAWLGAMGPFPWQYPALILAFLLVIWVDFKLVREEAAPAWYPLLRVPLTAGVIVCLVGGLAHAVLMR